MRAVSDAVAAGERAGIPFVLNARTDAFLRAGGRDRAEVLADAIERGRAYLDAGASTFFAPGLLDEPTVAALVEALGPQKVTVIGVPVCCRLSSHGSVGVARCCTARGASTVALSPWRPPAVVGAGGIPRAPAA